MKLMQTQTILCRTNYLEESGTDALARALGERLPVPFVTLCVGSDKIIEDSLGPLTGLFLGGMQPSLPVVGSLEQPVHKENVAFYMDLIRQRYPNHLLLTVDAAQGEEGRLGELLLLDGGIVPGGASAPGRTAGDFSLLGVTDFPSAKKSWLNRVRLNQVFCMAQVIALAVRRCMDGFVTL